MDKILLIHIIFGCLNVVIYGIMWTYRYNKGFKVWRQKYYDSFTWFLENWEPKDKSEEPR